MKIDESKVLTKILIVEDQSTDIAAPYYLTKHLGCSVTLAFDGEQALREFNKQDFDLIILDWNLPQLNGEDFLKSIEYKAQLLLQNNKGSKNLKVILHSGQELNIEEFQSRTGFEVLDIWQKPMSAPDMLKKLKRIQESRGEKWKI